MCVTILSVEEFEQAMQEAIIAGAETVILVSERDETESLLEGFEAEPLTLEEEEALMVASQ